MLLSSFLALAIALFAIYITINATDEIAQIAAALAVGFCLFLSLVFAPWLIKVSILIAILITQKHTTTLIQRTSKMTINPKL